MTFVKFDAVYQITLHLVCFVVEVLHHLIQAIFNKPKRFRKGIRFSLFTLLLGDTALDGGYLHILLKFFNIYPHCLLEVVKAIFV